jgi:hypothetical protein
VFVCLPAVLAARIGRPSDPALKGASIIAAILVFCIAIGGQVALRVAVTKGADGISEPRREIAETITATWRQSYGTPLPLVAGDQRLASTAIIFSHDHPQAWPSFNATHAPWIDPAAAARTGYVSLCRRNDSNCLAFADRVAGGRAVRCELGRRVEYMGAIGPWFEVVAFFVPPADSNRGLACPAE